MDYSWTVLLDLALALLLTHHLVGRMLRNYICRKNLNPLLSEAQRDYRVFGRYRFDEAGRLAFRCLMLMSLAYLVLPGPPWFAALALLANLMHLYTCHVTARRALKHMHHEVDRNLRAHERQLTVAVGG